MAICVMLVGACGSSARSGHGSTPPTTVPTARLDLSSAAGAAIPSAAVGGAAIYPVRPTNYVLDERLSSLGARGLVWRMNAHAVNVRDVQQFAKVLGLAGSPTRTSSGWVLQDTNAILNLFVSDGTVEVSYAFGVPNAAGGSVGSSRPGVVVTSGSAATNPASRVEPPLPPPLPVTPTNVRPAVTAVRPIPVPVAPRVLPPVDVPNAAQAQSIASGLLDRLGVLAGQQWSTDVSDSGGIAVACVSGMACATVLPEVFAQTVTFSLMLDGASVDGVTWSVTIGEHGRIESLNGEWATPAQLGSYPLRATTAAFTDLQHGDARYPGPQPMTAIEGGAVEAPAIATPPTEAMSAVHIAGVTLGIARWDAYLHGTKVVDLVPTYRFHASVTGGSSYDIEVLALAPNTITFTNPIPTPEPFPAQPPPLPVAVPGSPPLPSQTRSPVDEHEQRLIPVS
ncbi:MAG: hypothetical protein ACLPVY_08385 [Acidimicrobiia bacterium]